MPAPRDRNSLEAKILHEPIEPLHPAILARFRRVVRHHAPLDGDQLVDMLEPRYLEDSTHDDDH